MNLKIRPERVADYSAITEVHVAAFDERMSEALIVDLHRRRPSFDPGLSLVAEVNGQVVGHALFSPRTLRLLGEKVSAVNLAPIGVLPACQGQGIGAALIAEGHGLARAAGYHLSFLLGHPTYYPRFGYQTGAYGSSELTVAAPTATATELEERAPRVEDTPALAALWEAEEGDVDFALVPDDTLVAWLSPNPAIATTVFLRGSALVGYVRVDRDEPARPRQFLARDDSAARAMVALLAERCGTTQLVLPLHPRSRSAQTLGTATARPWQAAMALELSASPLGGYLAEVASGVRPAGRIVWPGEFDL